jgi:hypothetical protein
VNRHSLTIVCWVLISCTVPPARAETLSGNDRAFFENRIRPVLVQHCYQCHAVDADADKIGGNLLLDSRDALLAGGQSGPALVAGDPDASLMVQALRYDGLEMPPDKPLPAKVVRDFETWIRRGAADPRANVATKQKEPALDTTALWSFAPPSEPDVPAVDDRSWSYDPIDQFVLAGIEAAKLTPTSAAPPQTLIRRLYDDLLGLPPTAEQVESFVTEFEREGRQAVARLVDSLLDRPEFGERWGRHWLDVARYGESNGNDGLGRNAAFPHAWRYRDYVIDALNRDLPYDRFLTEQIAGDLLDAETAEQRNRQLVATGFLAIGAKPAAAMNNNFAMDVVDDQINTVCTAVMGLSVACARCHDHKHDPIPTRDYYALAGIFASTETLYGLAGNEKLTAPPTDLHTLVSALNKDQTDDQRKDTPKFPASYAGAIANLQPHLHAPLNAAPADLQVAGAESFSPENYAAVKTANLHGQLAAAGESYSVAFSFKNDTPNAQRPVTAYLFSRAKLGDKRLPGDHLGIGGAHDKALTGKLFVFNGNDHKQTIGGDTVIPVGSWNHLVLVRDAGHVKVFLNGALEIDAPLKATFGQSLDYCLANRSDKFAPLVGNLAHVAIFDRALSAEEAIALHAASGQPKGTRTLGLAMGVRDKTKPVDCKIHIGGETGKQGADVPRGFLTAYEQVSLDKYRGAIGSPVKIDAQHSGRRQLAAWLTHPDHPQTARVMANRIWLHLMGHGIVATPDDFGVYGARPTHPELLDHLANRFVRQGWSVKRLIRAIVLCRTYQLDSRADERLLAADPDNVWLARHDRRRLNAESLRDSMLAASGQLDRRPGVGSAVEKFEALINWPPGESTNLHRRSNHRSIYLCLLRHAPPPELAAFDLPDGLSVTSRRDETISPTQSLFLLNNEFVVAQSRALADQLLAAQHDHDAQRIRLLFRKILQRNPRDSELAGALRLLTTSAFASRQDAWASLCQALFATNEFRYID